MGCFIIGLIESDALIRNSGVSGVTELKFQ